VSASFHFVVIYVATSWFSVVDASLSEEYACNYSFSVKSYYINNNNNNNNKRLYIEIQRMRNLKCTIVPVITGATGIVTRNLRKNLEAVPGKHSIDSLQQTAILGTSHIIRKVLQCDAWSVSGGYHRWFKRSTGKKRPVTRDIHIK